LSRKLTAASNYTLHGPVISTSLGLEGRDEARVVDAASGTVYFVNPGFTTNYGSVSALNESGSLLELLEGGNLPTGKKEYYRGGMAINEESGEVYVSEENGQIVVWDGVVVPDIITGPPANIGHTEATLTGHVDPVGGGPVTGCTFQYAPASTFNEIDEATIMGATGGTFRLYVGEYSDPVPFDATAAQVQSAIEATQVIGPGGVAVSGAPGGPYTVEFVGPAGNQKIGFFVSYREGLTPEGAKAETSRVQGAGEGWESAGSASCEPPSTSEATDVEAQVGGLTTGMEYRYRLLASNANGTNIGTDGLVTPQPSLVFTGEATNIDRAGATLNGTVDPEGLETTYYFQYGKTTGYGGFSTAPPGAPVGSTEAGAKPLSAPVTGLEPGATYHYRIVAENSKGKSVGVDRTFTVAPAVSDLSTDPASEIHRTDVTLNGTLDPDGLETHYYFEYGKTKLYSSETAAPPGDSVSDTSPGDKQVGSLIEGLVPETTYHYRIVASNSYGTTYGSDRTVTTLPAVKDLATGAATEVRTTEATLNGTLDPDGYQTSFYFEWGKTKGYGHTMPAPPGQDAGSAPGATPVSAALQSLEPKTTYHFRLVGVNGFGETFGEDRAFSTPSAPSIEGVYSSGVSADGAELKARIDPNGFQTSYRFEYGTSAEYGQSAPLPDATLPSSEGSQQVTVAISGLQPVTYHFRLVAENEWGTTRSEDQSFNFNPPQCPNAGVRQQTGSAYLPDCRAYEIVSAARAGGAALVPEGPTSPSANNRFAYGGEINAIPGSGEPVNGGYPFPVADLYVASRSSTGWGTRYVGLSGKETIEQGGIPGGGIGGPAGILTGSSMDRILTWNRAAGARSYAPYVWDNEGNGHGRLPTNLGEVSGASALPAEGGFEGDGMPSADFSHYAFSSDDLAFAPGGQTSAPGSAYDNNLQTGAVELISKTATGADIPQDGTAGQPGEYIRFPSVSEDGSHILMSTAAPGGNVHLYLRVNDALTYEPSMGSDEVNHGVHFDGMSADGSEVFFTTAVQMTPGDHDTSADLYRWSENGGAPQLTRLSTGTEGSGDTDECNPGWTSKCDVEVVPTDTHQRSGAGEPLQPIDSALASQSGEIYFYSPETLEGSRGTPGNRNLYVYRNGAPQFVASLGSLGGASRINVAPDGSHMAFITTSKLASYDNAGHAEMFTYAPQGRTLICVSCKPDGSPPTSDVQGSLNGIFMADDGRAFFSTADALAPRDANGISDVYEYVEGQPQLISSGTSDQAGSENQPVGLVGVSADGTNAFFATYQTLVPQDENGALYKFYDARVNGGFPYAAPPAPCAAADECHGEGGSAPQSLQSGTAASLFGGNFVEEAKPRRKAHHHRKRKAHRRKHKRHHRRHGRARRHQRGARG
jgi:hypothetical protein